MMLLIGKIFAAILLPPGLFIAIIIVTALLGKKRWSKAMTFILVSAGLLMYLLSTVMGSNLLLKPLENAYSPITGRIDARGIVVLGGGYVENSPEYGGAGALSKDSEKRAIYGLELSLEYPLPLIFSGGAPYDSSQKGSEAEAAGRLWRRLGLAQDRMILETESKDTRGNARSVEKVAGKGPFILVTSAVHMPRSVLAFKKMGIAVIAAPTDYRAKRTPVTVSDFFPSAGALADSTFALHEYIGLLYYSLT